MLEYHIVRHLTKSCIRVSPEYDTTARSSKMVETKSQISHSNISQQPSISHHRDAEISRYNRVLLEVERPS